ncbi:MAG: DUF4366 domain-containing protein, partial [Oscillospiraceae bacterium]
MTFAFMLSVLSAVTITANAEESAETTKSETIEETSSETESQSETEESVSELETEESEEMPEISDEIDYYLDDYYDTKGNATLIKSERIIYDTELMQFIAVTTKSGDVFYVLINYSADNEEDSVYFLNKVDTLDLYALLYMTDEEEESGIDTDRVRKAEQAAVDWANSQNGIDNINETEENPDSESETPEIQPNSGMNNMMMLGIGAVALIAAGIVAFLIMKKKPVQKSEPELNYDDSDEDDDF